MSARTATRRPDLPATPALDRLLGRVRARLSAFIVLHGLASALAALAAWLLAAYALDRWLHLPGPIRVFHLAVLVALPAVLLVRELARPWRARPDDGDLAILVERAQPDLGEILVSAVQLREGRAGSTDPEIAARVVRDADARAGAIDTRAVLDARGPRRRALLATAAVATCGVAFISNPFAARIFFARIAGGATAWPQRTQLSIELPSAALDAVAPEGYALAARIARGSDLAIVVRAAGETPDEVVLWFADDRDAKLSGSSGGTFRTLLRAVQADLSFHATGGDDQDETPRVLVRALQPPDVVEVAIAIEPPAYSGLPARLERDRDVDVLAGSKVTVHVRTNPPDARGAARILPEDRVVPLVAAPFPPAAEGAPAVSGFAFDLEPHKTLRFRFELEDDTGLENPDPTLFAIDVVEDKAPEVEVLAPSRADVDTVATGLVRIRARAQDDFGIARMSWTSTTAGSTDESEARELTWRVLSAEELAAAAQGRDAARASAGAKGPRAVALANLLLEVRELARSEGALEGQQVMLAISVADNRAPAPHVGKAAPLRVRVVSSDEFLRRVQDRLARTQTSAAALVQLAREKERRVREIQSVLESDAPEARGLAGDLATALTGQRRVLGDARALVRELAGAAESVLYARIDDRAARALDLLDTKLAATLTRGFDPEPWRELSAASRAEGIAGSGLAGKLVDIVGLALEAAEDAAAAAEAALVRAQAATELAKIHAEIGEAAVQEKRCVEKLEALLEKLAEWDNFQSVLGLARDILNGQRTLSERTRQSATDAKAPGPEKEK